MSIPKRPPEYEESGSGPIFWGCVFTVLWLVVGLVLLIVWG